MTIWESQKEIYLKLGKKLGFYDHFSEGYIPGPDMKSEHFSFGGYVNILVIWNQFNINLFNLNLWPSRTLVQSHIFHFIWSQWIFKVFHSFFAALVSTWYFGNFDDLGPHFSEPVWRPKKLKFGFWTQNCLNFQDLLKELAQLELV